MFDKKSEYALNKHDQDSIIYISVSGRIRLTRADFPSEEEFLKWKTWSDADYHETEKKGRSFNDNRVYSQNYYRIVKEKNRTYYEVYSLPRTETPPEGYTQVSFVCLRSDGAYEAPATVSSVCRYSRKKIGDMDDFHFHLLRHYVEPGKMVSDEGNYRISANSF